MDKLLTVENVSEILMISPYTVRAMCRSKELPHIKVGGQYRFRESSIAKYIEENEIISRY